MDKKLNFINVVRLFPGNEEFAATEIRRQHRDVGIEKFAPSLSFHPTGTPASRNAAKLLASFRKLKEALADTPSIRLGVLIQSTLGHGWSGPVPLTGEPWQRIVKDNGVVTSRMCPSDPAFRQYVLECIDGIMKEGPAFLLLDDDFGLRQGECFCPNHIAMFNNATGVERSFDDVVAMIKERPADDPEVRIFSRQRGELILDFAREIRKVIDKYDDSIVCSMCTPGGGHGFVNDLTHILTGKNGTPSARVNNAIYGSNAHRYFLQLSTSTNRIRNVFSNVSDLLDEADTFPQTLYSENASLFNTHLVNAILNGLSGAKLWMFDFELPRSIGSQSRFEDAFRRNHPLYEKLFNAMDGIQWLGVKSPLTVPPDMLHPLKVSNRLYEPDWNSAVLGPFAIPFSYGKPTENGIFSLNGDITEQLADDEIMALLKNPTIIDSQAVKILVKRGFSEYIGVTVLDNPKFFFQSEADDVAPRPFALMWDASAAELKCMSEETSVESWCMFQNMETGLSEKVSPCMTFFRNKLGGRIVCLAWSSSMPYYKLWKNERRRIILKALDFLNGGLLEMSLETMQQAIVRHGRLKDGSELVAIISLTHDQEDAIPLRCAKAPSSVERLASNGNWEKVQFSQQDNILKIDMPLIIVQPVILRIVR